MLTTILIVVLILALIGALPTWGYSRNWGYGPGGGLGLHPDHRPDPDADRTRVAIHERAYEASMRRARSGA